MYHNICTMFVVTAPLDIRGLFGQSPSTECSVKLWQTLPCRIPASVDCLTPAGWSPVPRASISHYTARAQRDISSCLSPSFCRGLEQTCLNLQLWQLDESGSVPRSAHLLSYFSWSHSQCGFNLHPTHPQTWSYGMRYAVHWIFHLPLQLLLVYKYRGS